VFITPKNGVSDEHLQSLIHQFCNRLIEELLITTYQVFKTSQVGNFSELPRFQLVSQFVNQPQMDASMSHIRNTIMKDETHQALMNSVDVFKVSFSESLVQD
jgi:hypothetical protein